MRVASVLGLAAILGACNEPAVPQAEPEFATMRITIGTSTLNVTRESNAIAGTAQVQRGATVPTSVSFMLAGGQQDPLINPVDYELRVTTQEGGMTFTRVGVFGGNLTAPSAPGTALVRFTLYAIRHGHAEYEITVPITVQ